MQSKNFIRKLLVQVLCLLLLVFAFQLFDYLLAESIGPYLFGDFQAIRVAIFEILPFSVGDIIYAFFLLYVLSNFVLFVRSAKQYSKREWLIGVLQVTRFFLVLYFVVFVFWGLQYAQPKLSVKLQLPTDEEISEQQMIAFDSVLMERLNASVQYSQPITFQKLNQVVRSAFDKDGQQKLVNAKYSFFGKGVGYMGATGYFNPITGEAQVINGYPDFMMPFLIAHEMAHQTGIAAEDDANLLAYIRCVESKDSSLYYSACFNLWLYTRRKVWNIDSNIAMHLQKKLNKNSIMHFDSLKEWSKKNKTILDDFSSAFYDAYLRSSHQEEGIKSYRSVVYSAYLWEQKKRMNQ